MSDSDKPLVIFEVDGVIATLTLNRPERHNSLIPPMLSQFLDGLDKTRSNNDIQAVILKANGPSFSTGGDVAAFYNNRDDLENYANQMVTLLNQSIMGLYDLRVPIIAAVHGIVTGGSLGLVLASDIILFAPQASITPNYGVLGYSPDGGWAALLPRLIGARRTAESLLTNRTITAEEAVAWGIANRIVPKDKILSEAYKTAEAISLMKPGTIRSVKAQLRNLTNHLAIRLEEERARFVAQINTAEAIQGMEEFLYHKK